MDKVGSQNRFCHLPDRAKSLTVQKRTLSNIEVHFGTLPLEVDKFKALCVDTDN